MFAESLSVFGIFALITPVFLFIMLLPAFLELKKPQDSGPRRIMENVSTIAYRLMALASLSNIEAEQQIYSKPPLILSSVLSFLPKIED